MKKTQRYADPTRGSANKYDYHRSSPYQYPETTPRSDVRTRNSSGIVAKVGRHFTYSVPERVQSLGTIAVQPLGEADDADRTEGAEASD